MKSKYTIDYFIKKFEKIPTGQWTMGEYQSLDGLSCAAGHCGRRNGFVTREANELYDIFKTYGRHDVEGINDGDDKDFQQPTPKKRILAALKSFKEKEKKV